MGSLVSIIQNSNDSGPDIILDFENAQPIPEEEQLYRYVVEILNRSNAILQSLRQYTGCGELIRKAISNPSPQTEEEAWVALCPSAVKLKKYYEFSQRIEDIFPRILFVLCKGNITENLGKYQATTKKLADLLSFVLQFDDLKMTNPSIQNDFSYYRRLLSRIKNNYKINKQNIPVNDELANRMSLFYAYSTPMFKAVTDATIAFVAPNSKSGVSAQQVSECLSLMTNICYNAVSKYRVQSQPMISFCLRVMVGCIILFDHIDQEGAFHRNSKINIKGCIRLIQGSAGVDADSLLNTLRYTSKHLNDDSTPKNIKNLLN
ncbi:DUF1394-domain-containing protein [Piromyces finnis]|uniref:DUF1394-domain-containing protein n=1 Tax=Piromyces finnis TaxID=1754191 RepID=A0A1Y1V8A4_9FUNG|nr:DUF1394-domain-containing protein [Piromyces finnis]|eukprot:ORX48913.1 DUF1394-domain-containing protein [Piromyces finnis]